MIELYAVPPHEMKNNTNVPRQRDHFPLVPPTLTFADKIVGWPVSRSPKTDFELHVFGQTLHDRRPVHKGDLIHHSNRGRQYLSIRHAERFALSGIEPSVGSIGDSYDNPLAETVNGLYKAEIIHLLGRGKPWPRSNGKRSNGSIGSTTSACWNPSDTSHQCLTSDRRHIS